MCPFASPPLFAGLKSELFPLPPPTFQCVLGEHSALWNSVGGRDFLLQLTLSDVESEEL